MLKMNKDHQSARLWWSPLLSGSSLGGHGSFLGLISSCFVFPIVSPITVDVAADGLWKCLPQLMVNEKNQPPFAIMMPGDPHFTLGKCYFNISSTAPKREGKRGITWGALPLFFELFWRVLHHHNRCVFGVKWASFCFWLNWWPNAITPYFLLS